VEIEIHGGWHVHQVANYVSWRNVMLRDRRNALLSRVVKEQ